MGANKDSICQIEIIAFLQGLQYIFHGLLSMPSTHWLFQAAFDGAFDQLQLIRAN